MTTECNPAYLDFPILGPRQVLADFDGGAISSDGGALLLRQVEALTGIVRQFAACFDDHRDPDATDDPIHGHQLGRFFYAYYKGYCYLPLYISCGDHLLCARLRPADIDACAGSVKHLKRIMAQIREAWPGVKVVVRADSGF